MAFIVEDGSIVANSTSYASVVQFKEYCDDEGFDYTIYSPATKIQRALIKATRYINMRFTFKGFVLEYDQSLAWPRCLVYNKENNLLSETEIPKELIQATIEYAKRALVQDLAPDAVVDESGQRLKRQLSKIGPIEDEKVYFEGSQNRLQAYPSADLLIKPLIKNQSGQVYVK